MSFYIDEFRARVRSAHDPTGDTCHWTTKDSVKAGSLGPCNCPSQDPCDQHQAIKCYNTASVLSIVPQAETQYSPILDHLLVEMLALGDAIRSGNAILQKYPGYAEAQAWWDFSPDLLTNVMRGNAPAIKQAGLYICGIPLNAPNDTEPVANWAKCVCRTNKLARIATIKQEIASLNVLLTDEQPKLEAELNRWWPSIDEIVEILEVVEKGLEAVEFALEGATTAGIGLLAAGILLPPLTNLLGAPPKDPSDGYKILTLAMTCQWLGWVKICIMLDAIYLNQQVMAYTCITG